MTSARKSLLYTVGIILIVIVRSISKEACKKVGTCSCKFKNGSKVNLMPADGGSKPRFTGIHGADKRTFDWNPCTPFSIKGCKEVLSCQEAGNTNYPAGTKDTTFTMDDDGNVVITYGISTDTKHNTRQTRIILKCDPSKNGSKPDGFTGKVYPSYTGRMGSTGEVSTTLTVYTGTFSSKYCCATGGSGSGGLSPGSILLIVFFPLLLMYFIIGILVNRYGRGIESIPEVIPNYSFWADVPFLVKDGAVFTYDRVRTACADMCGKGGYAKI